MKDIDVYTRDAEQTRRNDVMKSIANNIKAAPYADLKAAIEKQVDNYIAATTELIQKQKFIPDLFCDHTASGLARAMKLKLRIGKLADDDKSELLNLVSTLNGGNYKQGSLKTFIAKAFHEVGTGDSKATRFSDKSDESVGVIIEGGEHSHYNAKADIGVVDFLKNIVSNLKEYFARPDNTPTP